LPIFPGIAIPCLEIEKNPHDALKYTARGNLVAVVSNGTAVLGLGDIGALAGKPVMEGKAVLFKRFADVDVFDLVVNSHDPEDVIKSCQLLEPTFGGINLEDIKAPECFYIEETLKKTMKIPVFSDDQHGTAIISGAALPRRFTTTSLTWSGLERRAHRRSVRLAPERALHPGVVPSAPKAWHDALRGPQAN
jgi:malate dehydrogenase (oxaloacetate-decarboxylating)(NADP+)